MCAFSPRNKDITPELNVHGITPDLPTQHHQYSLAFSSTEHHHPIGTFVILLRIGGVSAH